jgi:hypothetical protein
MLNLEKVHITETHMYLFFFKPSQVFVWCVHKRKGWESYTVRTIKVKCT